MAAPIVSGFMQFADNRGNAIAGGTVGFYQPGTTTLKPVWKDAARTIPSPNPVTLDSNGRAQAFGWGAYRQTVRTSSGQLVWDGETVAAGQHIGPLAVDLATLDVPDDRQVIDTSGFATPGKGAARYVRLAATPSLAEQASGNGRWLFQTAGGAWWRLAEEEPSDLMFGVAADAVASSAGGTMAVIGTDDTDALQAAIDFVLHFNPLGRKLRLPSGRRRITDTIHIGYGERYVDWIIEGDRGRAWDANAGYLAGIYAMFGDRPAINIQGARRAELRNLSVTGPNHAWLTANQVEIANRSALAGWRGPQAITGAGRNVPAAGITVDAYSGSLPTGPRYPDVAYPAFVNLSTQYDRGASSQVLFAGVCSNGFEVGICVQPNTVPVGSNGDFIRWTDCDLSWNEVAISLSHADARSVAFERTLFHFCHTAFDSIRFGQGTGNVAASFSDCSFDNCYQIFNVNLGITAQPFAPSILLNNPFAEALYRIGIVRTDGQPNSFAGSLRVTGGELGFFCRSGETTPVNYVEGRGEVSVSFEGVSIHGTYGVFPVDADVSRFAGAFPALAYCPFDFSTSGGIRAITALSGLFATRWSGPVNVRTIYTFGFNNANADRVVTASEGWNFSGSAAQSTGLPVPLFVRSLDAGGHRVPVGQAPRQRLDRAVHPLQNVQQNGIEWTFTCSTAFLTEPGRPDYCIGVGDIVRDEASGVLYYVRTVTWGAGSPPATVTLTVRQVTAVYSADGFTWTASLPLAAGAGVLRFHCARRVVAGRTRPLLLQAAAGSASATLLCPGSEAGADGQLNTPASPVLAAGDYLLASTADSMTPEQSVFPAARIVSVDVVTGAVQFDAPARRGGTFTSPLFVKAG